MCSWLLTGFNDLNCLLFTILLFIWLVLCLSTDFNRNDLFFLYLDLVWLWNLLLKILIYDFWLSGTRWDAFKAPSLLSQIIVSLFDDSIFVHKLNHGSLWLKFLSNRRRNFFVQFIFLAESLVQLLLEFNLSHILVKAKVVSAHEG